MKTTKEELLKKLEEYFKGANSSWFFLKIIIINIIEKYHEKLEEECIIEVSEKDSEYFYSCPQEILITTQNVLSEIWGIDIKSISFQEPNLTFKI